MKNLLAIVLAFCPGAWLCAQGGQLEDRDWELRLDGALRFTESDLAETSALRLDVGLEHLQSWGPVFGFGPVLSLDYSEEDGKDIGGQTRVDRESTSFLLGAEVTLNFPTDTIFVPFLRAAGGAAFGDFGEKITAGPSGARVVVSNTHEEDTAGFVRIGGGLRIFLAESVALNIGADYSAVFWDKAAGSTEEQVSLTVGLSVFF